jgi:hypothetical protein
MQANAGFGETQTPTTRTTDIILGATFGALLTLLIVGPDATKNNTMKIAGGTAAGAAVAWYLSRNKAGA